MTQKVSFPVFFMMWANHKGWKVPACHLKVCQWLGERPAGETSVLMAFRGFSKSTILGVYNAWCYYMDPTYRILHQGSQDTTAYKTSRDTKNVLKHHPLTMSLANIKGDTAFWWVAGADDERNPSMQAAGILTNIVSSRADEIQNDDVEVQGNIQTVEAREKLRRRLSEQTHIAIPTTKKIYIGTPHTHDSLYDEMIRNGAATLQIPLFGKEHRIERLEAAQVDLPFEPELVFANIYTQTEVLEHGIDYTYMDGKAYFNNPVNGFIDFYADCAWPERFDKRTLIKRRRETRTINEWDSQYQLHSKPVGEVRLNPDLMNRYEVEPVLRHVNDDVVMTLGTTFIVGCAARWDCALGKVGGDKSVLSIVYTDGKGHVYWHDAVALVGELEQQCAQIRETCKLHHVPHVVVETGNMGGEWAFQMLRKALKGTGITCKDKPAGGANKNNRIIGFLEPALSSGALWAHSRVFDSDAYVQMRQFNPVTKDNEDDYLDSLAGALEDTPVRIGKHTVANDSIISDNWRPSGGIHDVVFDYKPFTHH